MHIPKEYFQDRLALGLSVVSFLAVIATITIVLIRALGGSGGSFIVGYRSNLGIEAFKSGGLTDILSLLVFVIVVFVFQIVLCWRTYQVDRRLSIGVLSAGLFLILLDLIVANSLLALH